MIEPRIPSSWDEVFMQLAHTVAQRSKDPNTQVGAVIIDTCNRIVSMGFNGPPRAIVDTMFSWERPEKYSFVKHAEDNAIWFGACARGWDGLNGTALYVTGKPCQSCMLSIVRAEIVTVIFDSSKLISMMNASEWELTQRIAKLGGVELREYK